MKNKTVYMILTICSLMLPINRIYLGNTKRILTRCFTFNYMLFGWLTDLIYMGKDFDEAMAKRGYVRITQGAKH